MELTRALPTAALPHGNLVFWQSHAKCINTFRFGLFVSNVCNHVSQGENPGKHFDWSYRFVAFDEGLTLTVVDEDFL